MVMRSSPWSRTRFMAPSATTMPPSAAACSSAGAPAAGPGKLQGQELKSCLSCLNPPRHPFSLPSSSASPLSSPSSSPSSSTSPSSTPTVSTSTSHGAPDSLLYIRDTLSRRLFLVDTVATISVFPHRSLVSAATSLRAAGGQPILSWGKHTIPLSFSSTLAGPTGLI